MGEFLLQQTFDNAILTVMENTTTKTLNEEVKQKRPELPPGAGIEAFKKLLGALNSSEAHSPLLARVSIIEKELERTHILVPLLPEELVAEELQRLTELRTLLIEAMDDYAESVKKPDANQSKT